MKLRPLSSLAVLGLSSLCCLSLYYSSLAFASPPSLKLTYNKDNVTVDITASDAQKAEVFLVEDPNRIVVDLPSQKEKFVRETTQPNPVFSQIRIGRHPEKTRLVFDVVSDNPTYDVKKGTNHLTITFTKGVPVPSVKPIEVKNEKKDLSDEHKPIKQDNTHSAEEKVKADEEVTPTQSTTIKPNLIPSSPTPSKHIESDDSEGVEEVPTIEVKRTTLPSHDNKSDIIEIPDIEKTVTPISPKDLLHQKENEMEAPVIKEAVHPTPVFDEEDELAPLHSTPEKVTEKIPPIPTKVPTVLPSLTSTSTSTATAIPKLTATSTAAPVKPTEIPSTTPTTKTENSSIPTRVMTPSASESQTSTIVARKSPPPVTDEKELYGVLFRSDKDGPLVEIQLTKRPDYVLSKVNPRRFKISLSKFAATGKGITLPHFPPNDIVGFSLVQVIPTDLGVDVFVGVDDGMKATAVTMGSSIIVRATQGGF